MGNVAGVGGIHRGGTNDADNGCLIIALVHDRRSINGVIDSVGETSDVVRIIVRCDNGLYINGVGERPGGVIPSTVFVVEGEATGSFAIGDLFGSRDITRMCQRVAAGVGDDR